MRFLKRVNSGARVAKLKTRDYKIISLHFICTSLHKLENVCEITSTCIEWAVQGDKTNFNGGDPQNWFFQALWGAKPTKEKMSLWPLWDGTILIFIDFFASKPVR